METATVNDYKIIQLIASYQINEQNAEPIAFFLISKFYESHLPYSEISKYVFGNDFFEDDLVFVQENMQTLTTKMLKIPNCELTSEQIQKIAPKIERHFQLAMIQKDFIQSNIVSLEWDINNSKYEISSFTEDTKKTLKEVSRTKGQMYTEFVAILGIFSGLIFALFGGFDTLSSTISTLGKGEVPLTNILIVTSILLAGLSLIIFTLMQGISKLTNRSLRSCGCENKRTCSHSIYQRHPMICWIIGLLMLVFFGSLFVANVPQNLLNYLPLIIIIFSVIFFISFVFIIFRVPNKWYKWINSKLTEKNCK
ncbi:hypothetical protein H8962_001402 [Listeria monocytogenes]|uniref:hypothetical protein n=1 Tax=Listeria monocytogenes TaxID=1639 RepID=UPI000542E631|nr:hypothetical protein [Listeria monocytogenes]AWN07852.1 hypothetical protein [Listeria phage PSU-VKH-LP019]EAA0119944.1 hypothetical protein [Listeria monocytogenes]EAA0123913.1 hypothetical protein [Listeria monocytogenes]EAC2225152.1 hypothetical protein [Listeria monocytogenes]EAC2257663.1 hypothetical protein [Listeria monocytogenes]